MDPHDTSKLSKSNNSINIVENSNNNSIYLNSSTSEVNHNDIISSTSNIHNNHYEVSSTFSDVPDAHSNEENNLQLLSSNTPDIEKVIEAYYLKLGINLHKELSRINSSSKSDSLQEHNNLQLLEYYEQKINQLLQIYSDIEKEKLDKINELKKAGIVVEPLDNVDGADSLPSSSTMTTSRTTTTTTLVPDANDSHKLTLQCNQLISEMSSISVNLLENQVNRGNFGNVKCVSKNNILVAEKILFRYQFQNKEINELFDSEVNIASKLNHGNIVKYLGSEKINFAIYFEWMSGGTLDQFLMNSNGIAKTIFDKKPIIRKMIALDIAKGMKYLHGLDSPIFHRDLTTSNILLDNPITLNVISDGGMDFNTTCKIADFGLSRHVVSGEQLTTTFGNLPFVAPELYKGDTKRIGLKCDVYSFSMILWKMFSYEEPNSYLGINENIARKAKKGYRPPTDMIEDQQWLQLINECWQMDPDDRPTFDEIITTLEKFN